MNLFSIFSSMCQAPMIKVENLAAREDNLNDVTKSNYDLPEKTVEFDMPNQFQFGHLQHSGVYCFLLTHRKRITLQHRKASKKA